MPNIGNFLLKRLYGFVLVKLVFVTMQHMEMLHGEMGT